MLNKALSFTSFSEFFLYIIFGLLVLLIIIEMLKIKIVQIYLKKNEKYFALKLNLISNKNGDY
jgi:hypothetical protein